MPALRAPPAALVAALRAERKGGGVAALLRSAVAAHRASFVLVPAERAHRRREFPAVGALPRDTRAGGALGRCETERETALPRLSAQEKRRRHSCRLLLHRPAGRAAKTAERREERNGGEASPCRLHHCRPERVRDREPASPLYSKIVRTPTAHRAGVCADGATEADAIDATRG